MIDRDLLERCKTEHLRLHDLLREAHIGRDVILKNCLYGKNRRGQIADMILTYDASFGVDIYRLDGTGFCEERQWTNARNIVE